MQEQLQKCQGLISNDYFLAEVKDTFTKQARMAVFEVYCRIHQRINLDALATQVRPATPPPPSHASYPPGLRCQGERVCQSLCAVRVW